VLTLREAAAGVSKAEIAAWIVVNRMLGTQTAARKMAIGRA